MQAGVDEQRRHLADAADVLVAAGLGEIEILVEAVAHVVAVQQVAVMAALHQRLFERIGDGRLARARQPGEPHHGRLLALLVGAHRGGDARRLPHHVGAGARGLRMRRDDHAGAHGAEVQQVDDDERARGATDSL